MKKQILNLAILALLLAGFIACDRNDEVKSDEVEIEEIEDPVDFDFSGIDFSNIANLCKQPIPVIEKAIQGKWNVVYHRGGYAGGIWYSDGYFVEFTADKKFISTVPPRSSVLNYTWNKEPSSSEDYRYIMAFPNSVAPSLLIEDIHNDTLVFSVYRVTAYVRQHCVRID
jgi:hypothetical protein